MYKEGNGVVVKRSLGKENDQGAGKYYHGASMKEFPLGSRGIIIGVGSSYYKVNFNGNIGYFEERELAIDEKLEKEKQERVNSSLEKALLNSTDESISNPGERSLDPIETEGGRKLPGTLVKILKYFTNPFYNSTPSSSFDPKFNAREEFAVWLRQQFPDLPPSKEYDSYDYSGGRGQIEYSGGYHFPKERKREIKEAAKKACEHGVKTAEGCVSAYFENCRDRLNNDFDGAIFCLLNLIENVSVNLPHGSKHYGTHVRGRR